MANNTLSIGQQVGPGEHIVSSTWSPVYGWLNLTNRGGVYTGGGGTADIANAENGGSFLGYAGGRADPDTEIALHGDFAGGSIQVDASGGYTLVNAGGERYSFSAPASGSAPPPAVPAAAPAGPTAQQQSARAMLQSTLTEFGLGSLADALWQQYLSGVPMEQIMLNVRQTPEWKAQYGVIDQLVAKGRAITEQEVIGLRRQFAQVARAAGLPPGFYDSNDDFDRYIAGEVSPAEYNERVQLAARAAFQSPPEFRQEMQALYDVTPGDLIAYWIDPDKALPLVQQRYLAAQQSTAARRSGYGALTRDEAERLASLGVTEDQANQGFSQLATSRELFGSLPGENADNITRDEQMAAVFDNSAAAQERIRRAQERRVAAGRRGGGFAASQRGIVGLGTADA